MKLYKVLISIEEYNEGTGGVAVVARPHEEGCYPTLEAAEGQRNKLLKMGIDDFIPRCKCGRELGFSPGLCPVCDNDE